MIRERQLESAFGERICDMHVRLATASVASEARAGHLARVMLNFNVKELFFDDEGRQGISEVGSVVPLSLYGQKRDRHDDTTGF